MKTNPFLLHSLALAASSALFSTGSASGQTYYFDVNDTSAGSGVADTGTYDWHGAFWDSGENTGTAATGTTGWGATGNSVVFAATADVGANSYTVTLPGSFNQTWVKDLTVNSGNLAISNGFQANFVLGATSTWTVASGSTLSINSSGWDWRAVNMNASSLSLDTQGDAAIAGMGNSNGSLTKTGNGTLTLTDNSYYGGDTTISAGTLRIGDGGNNGSLYGATVSGGNLTFSEAGAIVNNGSLVYNLAGGAVHVNQSISGSGTLGVTGDQSVHFANGTSITTTGSQTYTATATGGRYFGFNLADNATVTLASTAGDIAMTGMIGTANDHTGNLIVDTSGGNGAITLNTPVGVTFVDFGLNSLTANAGTGAISLGTDNAQPWGTVNTVSLTGGAINSTATMVAFTTLTVNNSAAGTFSGNLTAGGGSFVKDGSGTLTITGAVSYGGTTTISDGTLALQGGGGGGSDYNAGNINIQGASTLRVSGLRYNFNGKTFTFDSTGGGTIDAIASGAGGFVFMGNNTFATSGGAKNLMSGTRIGAQNQGFNLNVQGAIFNVALGTDATSDLEVVGTIWNGGSVTKNGPGRMEISAPQQYAGDTTVNEGTLILGDGSNNVGLSDSDDVSIDSDAVLHLDYPEGSPDTVDKLFLGGVQVASGTWGALGSVTAEHTSALITGTGLLNVLTGPPIADPFANWMATNHPTILSPDNEADADPDDDGIENLIEYVLEGGDPSVSTTGILPTLDASGANFVFTYYRRAAATGTTQTFQYGTDLIGWTDVAIPGGSGVSVVDQGGGIDKVDITVAKGANPELFGRLQITQP